jgi:PAS domain S-box-containing protein
MSKQATQIDDEEARDEAARQFERIRTMLDDLPSMIWTTNSKGEVDFLNQACLRFCGLEKGEPLGDKAQLLTHPVNAPEYSAAFERAVKERTSFSAEAQVVFSNGESRILGTNARPCILPNGVYQGHIGSSADITERRKAENDQEFESSLIHSILEETLEGLLVVDNNEHVIWYNQRFLQINCMPESYWPRNFSIGMTEAEDREFKRLALDPIKDRETHVKRIQELIENPAWKFSQEIQMKGERTVEVRSSPLFGPEGKYLGRVWFSRDFTSQKQTAQNLLRAKTAAEEASRQLLAKRLMLGRERRILRALIDNIPDFMYVKDKQGRFLLANESLARAVGMQASVHMLGKTDFDLFAEPLAKQSHENDLELLKTGAPVHEREEIFINRSGHKTHLLTSKAPIRDTDGKIWGIAGVGRDITARKEYADALLKAEQKYRGIFDNSLFGIFQSTPQGRYLNVNKSYAASLGYDSPDELQEGVTDIGSQVYADPGARKKFIALMAASGSVQNFEFEARRKDGGKIWVSVTARAIYQEGEIVLYEGMSEDITERKLLRDQLFQAQKLESVGQLAAGIAHEINTPTQYIGDNVRFSANCFRPTRGC